MTDRKLSHLINRQVPEFIREEYPKFISFLEAYYEFMDNDALDESKKLRYVSDVDYSMDQFETQFFNGFMNLIPKDVAVSKELLIKNIHQIYLSKGSEASFKLLFRLLFDENVTVTYPKNSILRASDGKWNIENVLRVSKAIKTTYLGDGVTDAFILANEQTSDTITVYLNGEITTDYTLAKEYRKLKLNTTPLVDDLIEVEYDVFDISLLVNRKLIGTSSGATALIEKVNYRRIGFDDYVELYINEKTKLGNFTNGENVTVVLISDVYDPSGVLTPTNIDVKIRTLSDLKVINVVTGGSSYNVGDPVIVTGEATRPAVAIVSDIASGVIESVVPQNGGAGFVIGNVVEAVNIASNSFFATIQTVDGSGLYSPNLITFFTETIDSIDISTITIGETDYGLENPATNTTIIGVALANTSLNVGPITAINVTTSTITSAPNGFDVTPNSVTPSILLSDLGIIGKIKINNGGLNYNVGEQLVFTNQPDYFNGSGAAGHVYTVAANGCIETIKITSGGTGYLDATKFPSISIANGSNANVVVECIMGDGESLLGLLEQDALGNILVTGQVLAIKILDQGEGYTSIPSIDLTQSGNPNDSATANAELQSSYLRLNGKWTSADGILSTEDMKLQGENYYVNFSYLLSSKVEFNKYREIFKQLIHPSGFVNYNQYKIEQTIPSANSYVRDSSHNRTVTGTVSIANGSTTVTGSNTKFELTETSGLLKSGNTIAIGTETRTVDSIISNTEFTVTSAFTTTVNNESLLILL